MTLVLGIDPGTAITGYGLVREIAGGSLEMVAYGTIQTSSQLEAHKRLLKLYKEIKDIIFLHHPDSCAVEKLFFQRNVSTAIAVGQARGVVLLALQQPGQAEIGQPDARGPVVQHHVAGLHVAMDHAVGVSRRQTLRNLRSEPERFQRSEAAVGGACLGGAGPLIAVAARPALAGGLIRAGPEGSGRRGAATLGVRASGELDGGSALATISASGSSAAGAEAGLAMLGIWNAEAISAVLSRMLETSDFFASSIENGDSSPNKASGSAWPMPPSKPFE